MNPVSNNSKQQLRQVAARQREALSEQARRHADAAICRRLADLPELRDCRLLAAFSVCGAEPDLGAFQNGFIAGGGRLFLPRSRRDATGRLDYELAEATAPESPLVGGAFGIMEPAPHLPAAGSRELQHMYWLVPGIAFDSQCRRLGRGKGFYDRLLGSNPGVKIGIFYECQQLAEVPVEEHDCPLDMIVTETKVYRR